MGSGGRKASLAAMRLGHGGQQNSQHSSPREKPFILGPCSGIRDAEEKLKLLLEKKSHGTDPEPSSDATCRLPARPPAALPERKQWQPWRNYSSATAVQLFKAWKLLIQIKTATPRNTGGLQPALNPHTQLTLRQMQLSKTRP